MFSIECEVVADPPTYNKLMPMYNQWLHDHSLIPHSELQRPLMYEQYYYFFQQKASNKFKIIFNQITNLNHVLFVQ